MTPLIRARRERWGSALLSAALLLPIVLAIGIVVYARQSERAQRELAERALAHYAAVAAWQLASRMDAEYHERIELLVRPVVPGMNGDHMPMASGEDSAGCDCVQWAKSRATFIYKPGTLRVITGEADSATRALLTYAADSALRLKGSEPHQVMFFRPGGPPRAVSMLVPHGDEGIVYGAESDPLGYSAIVSSILAKHAVLPPQLLAPPYTPRELAVRVTTPAGFLLFTNDSAFASTGAVRDSLPRYSHLRVDTRLAPAVAEALIIGGLPPTRVPALLALLAVATLLAGAALVQHRRARELNRMRTQFIASVSHELRTPLTQISMFGETLMLGRERSEPERRQFASIIHREATRLSSLVDNVLRYTRGGADRFALRPEVRRLADDIDQAIAAFRPIAEASSARIEVDLDRGIHASVDADALRQIVLNLLDNAVKYGPPGQRIDVSLVRDVAGALLSIADEGPGIPDADRERIFEPFTRLEPAPRKVAGTGIGLAVVRELVTALGGTVTAASRPEGGAVLSVRIPVVAADASRSHAHRDR